MISIVGELYGQLLAVFGRPEAVEVLERSRQAWEILGWADRAGRVGQILAGIDAKGK